MPTYIYRFHDSDDTIEVQQSFTDEALTEAVHPVTGELTPVRKVFTPVGVSFKGNGFYKNDSRGRSSSTSTSSSSSSESSSTASSDSSGSSSSPATPSSGSSSPSTNGHAHSNGHSHSHSDHSH